MGLNRREFLRAAGAAAYGAAWLPLPFGWGVSGSIAVVGSRADSDYARGVILGMEEGERSAELLRRPPPFVRVDPPRGSVSSFVHALRERGIAGIIAALPGEVQAALERAAVAEGRVVVDARAARPDAAPDAAAAPAGADAAGVAGVFRTGLPARAYERAFRRAVDSDTSAAAAPAAGARAVLWHEDLFRYGAQQLNDRYRRRFGVGMTGAAWAGWMAVKALSEAVLRARGGGARELLERLGGSRAAFDGHKGVPLTFSGPAGTLAQPLYVVTEEGTMEVDWPIEGGEA